MSSTMDASPEQTYLRGEEHDTLRTAAAFFNGSYTPTPRRRHSPPPALDLSRRSKSTSYLAVRPPPAPERRTATTAHTTATSPTTPRHPRNHHRRRHQPQRKSTSFFDPANLDFYTHLAAKISAVAREANDTPNALRSALTSPTTPTEGGFPFPLSHLDRPREDPYDFTFALPPDPQPPQQQQQQQWSSVPGSSAASSAHPSRRHSRVALNSHYHGERCKPGSVTPQQRALFARIDGTAEGIEFYFGPGSGATQKEVDEFFSQPEGKKEGEEELGGPDFVNVDKRLEGLAEVEEEEEEEEEEVYDKEYLKSLVKQEGRFWPWIAKGFAGAATGDLWSDSEDDEEEEEEVAGEVDPFELERRLEEERRKRRAANEQRLQQCTITPLDATNDPPPAEDGGLWSDVSWLFSVATKVLLK